MYSLPGLKEAGIGVDAAKDSGAQPRLVQGVQYPVQQAAALGAVSPINHQNPFSPQLGGFFPGLVLGARAENYGGGLIKFKRMHGEIPLSSPISYSKW